ncbi:MAG: DsbA family oxidoreductase [Deltaproteobacteria bacterium]|nr:DsbA family oxidoreductase [Deltaproteobacteria bacterium]
MKKLRVEVWSDIACPWCYVGKRRLEAALAEFPHKDEVVVMWRAFELDPSAPRERDPKVSYAARLADKYGTSTAAASAKLDHMTELARSEGLDLRFDRVRAGNTFDAHRVIHFAGERSASMQNAVKERLLRAYMTEGELMSDAETLARLAGEVGLDPAEVRAMLASDAFTEEVRDDESEAAELGITGVPFFVVGNVYAVSGAQPKEVLLAALEKAWAEVDDDDANVADGGTQKDARGSAQGRGCG